MRVNEGGVIIISFTAKERNLYQTFVNLKIIHYWESIEQTLTIVILVNEGYPVLHERTE